ncbi:hypothetical protein H4219_001499 [Mycoemilia scoparia]|uniref:Palmitoyltransferase n=1 Tax=Mycoemilia scoparia TaxID=417184 RepID=A0A9W8A0S1_9FUNG|nr:hypothetical protein H4219_001499 [Mycoemilia scoparia]
MATTTTYTTLELSTAQNNEPNTNFISTQHFITKTCSGGNDSEGSQAEIESILASFRTKRSASTVVIFDSDCESEDGERHGHTSGSPEDNSRLRPVATLPRRESIPEGANNHWHRRHAFQRPLDPWFVRHWIFFVFMTSGVVCLAPYTPLMQRAGYPLLAAGFVLDVWISVTDTTDPTVRAAKIPRNPDYVMRRGYPVINPDTGFCHICLTYPLSNAYHCKLCNKCIAGYDHHCRFLNCCIGSRNYWPFCLFLLSIITASVITLHAFAQAQALRSGDILFIITIVCTMTTLSVLLAFHLHSQINVFLKSRHQMD